MDPQTIITVVAATGAGISAVFGGSNRLTLRKQGTPSNGLTTAKLIEVMAVEIHAVAEKLDAHLAETEPYLIKLREELIKEQEQQ